MTIDATERRSRRALLAAAATASTAAAAAAILTGPRSAAAATGDALIIGQFNQPSADVAGNYPPTRLTSGGTGRVLELRATGTGSAVGYPALSAESFGAGGIGVGGTSQASDGTAVQGIAFSGGTGVLGYGDHGTAIRADTIDGYALQTSGRLDIGTSGVATIPAGQTSVAVPAGVDVTEGSFVLLTPRSNLGGRDLWYTLSKTTNTITIRISSARPKATKVGWLLLG